MIRRTWIDKGDAVSVVQQCALAGVSRATVYARQQPKPVDQSDLLHSHLIDEEFTRHPFYGTFSRTPAFLSTEKVERSVAYAKFETMCRLALNRCI